MTEFVYGLLHGVDEKKRVLAIKTKHRVRFFYMAKGMFSGFMNYFGPGIYVYMTVLKACRPYKGYSVQNVVNVEKVMAPNRQRPKMFYDVSIIKAGVKSIVNSNKPKLFVDFEMSMPPYRNYQNFISEIIQVGMILTDVSGKILEEHSFFIKPTLFPQISDRTEKFLHISQDDIMNGKDYRYFHEMFFKIQNTFRPMIFIWGKNDKLELKKMNGIHQLEEFTVKSQFIDLLQLHKIYFGLKNDLGLFSAYNMYSSVDLTNQLHDAFQDASVTKNVFFWFQDVINGKLMIETKNDNTDTSEDHNEAQA